VLANLSADLCRAVTGRADADEILASLARRNLFVARGAPGKHGYRYHHLLGDLLRSRLEREDAAIRRGAHLDAAYWFERTGDIRSAAHHFAEAGAYEHALPLMLAGYDGPSRRVSDGAVEGGAGRLPDAVIQPYVEDGPARAYAEAAMLIRGQRPAEAARVLRQIDSTTADNEQRRQWQGRAEYLWALYADTLGDPAAVLEHCAAASELMCPASATGPLHSSSLDDRWLAMVDAAILGQLPPLASRAHASLGQLDQARASLAAHFGTPAAAEAAHPATLAMIAVREGRLRDAFRLGKMAIRQNDALGAVAGPASVEARLALAGAFFEHNELDMAKEQLDAALEHCRPDGTSPWLWAVEASLARVLIAQGRPGGALNRLGDIRQLGLRNPPPHHLLQEVNTVEIVCRLSLGDLEGALLVARSFRAGDIPAVTLGRIELCSGRPDRASSRLSSNRPASVADEIRRLVLLACAEVQQGHTLAAHDALGRAVDAGRPDGFIRPFVDEGAQVLPLLRGLLAKRPDPYVTELARQVERVVPNAAQSQPSGIVEPLTAREREVLGFLPSHLSGRDIAAKIYVSPNTVKSHMKAIYRKIGAASRSEAVDIAISRGLL
jgi:LuxR family transcriptional regulator, maltose regulon positive regulatory protein